MLNAICIDGIFFGAKKTPQKRGAVPGTGIEPAHPCERQILSLLRLPIPPPGPEKKKLPLGLQYYGFPANCWRIVFKFFRQNSITCSSSFGETANPARYANIFLTGS